VEDPQVCALPGGGAARVRVVYLGGGGGRGMQLITCSRWSMVVAVSIVGFVSF
jgi:hypothetical protein